MAELAQQLINGISWGSIYALIALGYTMVYGVLQFINFAHGDVYMVGAMAAYYTAHWLGIAANPSPAGFVLVLLLSMLTCGLLGMLIERFAYRPLRGRPRLTVLITAIGVSLFLENSGILVFGADPKFFPTLIPTSAIASVGDITVTNIQLGILLVSLLLMAALRLIVLHTRTGAAMRAVAFNPAAAALMGINVNRIISFTFVLGSALAAAAGVLVGMSNPKIDPLMGIMPGLKAFVAAVVGGIGNLPGAVVGGLVMGIIETLVVGYLSSTYRDAIAFVLLIAILLIKPSGLFGSAVAEKA